LTFIIIITIIISNRDGGFAPWLFELNKMMSLTIK